MDDLDQRAERLLATFRQADAFDAKRQQEVHERLARSLDRPRPAWIDHLEGPPAPVRRASWAWVWGIAAAAVLLAAAVTGWRSRATREDPTGAQEAADRAVVPKAGGVVVPREPSTPRPTEPPVNTDEPATSDPSEAPGSGAVTTLRSELEPPPARPARPGSTGTPATAPARTPDQAGTPASPVDPLLRRELRRIDEVHAALRAGRVNAAAEALARYEREFGSGQLREEARGLRVLVDCHNGAPGAVAAAELYLRLHPRSVLEGRIGRACPIENEDPATDPRPPVQRPFDEIP